RLSALDTAARATLDSPSRTASLLCVLLLSSVIPPPRGFLSRLLLLEMGKPIITSHNTIIVHSQLIRYHDIAFFTSPIPLHIAAMVILYGHVWLAIDMLPRFRWRWERKDVAGGHPLIARLAERVMEVKFTPDRSCHAPGVTFRTRMGGRNSGSSTTSAYGSHARAVGAMQATMGNHTSGNMAGDKNMVESVITYML
ncbi:hypothetical protein MPER_02314, partial [Moniliophthora perniciosa FA553]